MSDLSDLYQEVILDHYRNPRNRGPLPGADRTAEGYNPLCGDQLQVHVKLDGDRVEQIRFEGTGCAISQASASVMTTVLRGKTKAEIDTLFETFQRLVTGKEGADLEAMGELAALSGVSEFPARVKCATLGWHTLLAALQRKDTVSTE
jgi:nitrogen fixation NifU-like protein